MVIDAHSSDECTHDDGTAKAPAATAAHRRNPTLVKAVPSLYPSSLPFPLPFLSRVIALLMPSIFYLAPLMVALPPFLYLYSPRSASFLLVLDIVLMTYPTREWPALRRLFQLWYSLFDVHHNLSVPPDAPFKPPNFTERQKSGLYICAMHPHGIIPIQGFIWCSFCDQFLPDYYGFGAATDAAMRLPLLRQVLGWLGSGGAGRDTITKGLRGGENLFILPGGVAEIFLSHPGTHAVKARRRGLMKIALKTGANLVPVYVFGGNDFYHQLATLGGSPNGRGSKKLVREQSSNLLGMVQERISRTVRAGFTIWWGKWGTPMPFIASVSLVLGDPIETVPGTMGEGRASNGAITCRKIEEPTDAQVDELLARYVDALQRLFDQYKVEAGCADAELEIS